MNTSDPRYTKKESFQIWQDQTDSPKVQEDLIWY